MSEKLPNYFKSQVKKIQDSLLVYKNGSRRCPEMHRPMNMCSGHKVRSCEPRDSVCLALCLACNGHPPPNSVSSTSLTCHFPEQDVTSCHTVVSIPIVQDSLMILCVHSQRTTRGQSPTFLLISKRSFSKSLSLFVPQVSCL